MSTSGLTSLHFLSEQPKSVPLHLLTDLTDITCNDTCHVSSYHGGEKQRGNCMCWIFDGGVELPD